jgi:hypothetical protein
MFVISDAQFPNFPVWSVGYVWYVGYIRETCSRKCEFHVREKYIYIIRFIAVGPVVCFVKLTRIKRDEIKLSKAS